MEQLGWRLPPEVAALQDHYDSVFPECSVPSHGLHDTLQTLRDRGICIGVITNGRTSIQRRKLENMGVLSWLNPVVISESAGAEKPHRQIFRIALDAMGLAPEQTWFVGDHPLNDILGARDAGLTPVWVRGHHPWPSEHVPPDHEVDSLRGVAALLNIRER